MARRHRIARRRTTDTAVQEQAFSSELSITSKTSDLEAGLSTNCAGGHTEPTIEGGDDDHQRGADPAAG